MTSPGPLLSSSDLKKALQERLQAWLPAYLHALEEVHEGLALPAPKSWHRLPDFRRIRDDQSPTVTVTAPGIRGRPERDSDGSYRAAWELHVYVVVRGKTFEDTDDKIGFYTRAISAAVVQAGLGLPGVGKPRLIGEGNAPLAADNSRTVGGGVLAFEVIVGDFLNDLEGPLEPPEAPAYEFPEDIEVQSVEIEVEAKTD